MKILKRSIRRNFNFIFSLLILVFISFFYTNCMKISGGNISLSLESEGHFSSIAGKFESTSSSLVVANRYFIQSNLKEIFVSDIDADASDVQISQIIDKYVLDKPEAFGGNCSRYDLNCVEACGAYPSSICLTKQQIHVTAKPNPVYSSISKGYKIQVCEEILSIEKAGQTALLKSGLDLNAPIHLQNIANLYSFMTQYRPYDDFSIQQLLNVSLTGQQAQMSNLDQWRFIMLAICVSTQSDLL